MKALLKILVMAVLTAVGAMADIGDIVITFDNPNQTSSPGATLTFFGTILNKGSGTVYLNAAGLNLAGNSFSTDPFIANVPITLGSGSSGDIELFDVVLSNPLSPLDPPGTYAGTYTLAGGVDGNAQDFLASADFTVTLPGASVPEPSAMSLLGAELAALLAGVGIACRLRRRSI